ncbi:calcium-binding protein, partial [Bradyrhizobium yuanmingense]|uniref:calcium-binding protein n=1 Tax=Bradyrhizobium yuanmingense TaxID=108015 RepID=UPI0023B8F14C
MTSVIYLDANQIIDALRAGGQAGSPTAILDLYRDYARKMGAEIRITDIVRGEVVSEPNGTLLRDWMNANGISETVTNPALKVIPDAGERSILYDVKQSNLGLRDVTIFSDNKTQLNNGEWLSRVSQEYGIDSLKTIPEAVSWLKHGVANSSEALAVSAAATDLSSERYTELGRAYQNNPVFDPTKVGSFDKRQFLYEPSEFDRVRQAIKQLGTPEGPIKFGGVQPLDPVALGRLAAQGALDGLAGNVNALKGALGVIGQALVLADIAVSVSQALAAVANNDLPKAQRILAQLEGRALLGIAGAYVGDIVGTSLGSLAGQALSRALAAAVAEGVLVGLRFGPLGAALGGLIGAVAFGLIGTHYGNELAKWLLEMFNRDPIVLDLNGDGIQLSALSGSQVHFDFVGDGFKERTGWVSSADGILAIDLNANGVVDNGLELFGSSTQDGFAVLEKADSNGDGVINAQDADFGKLKVWRDLNQNGASDAGELQSLAEAGIASISLVREQLQGTNAGHGLGYQAVFTRSDGTTGISQTVYFETDAGNSLADNSPSFVPSLEAMALPNLPGTGQIYSTAYRLTTDPAFAADWTALTDNVKTKSPAELHAQFEALLLRWAGVDGVDPQSRGPYIDARHLSFIEKYFGQTYREVQSGGEIRTYPGERGRASPIEATYQGLVSVYETWFLSQTATSLFYRGIENIETLQTNPYFYYSLLDFGRNGASDTIPCNVGSVVDAISSMAIGDPGFRTAYLIKALQGLEGVIHLGFAGDRAAYSTALQPYLANISDDALRSIAGHVIDGTALFGTTGSEGINGTAARDVFIGGGGGDLLSGGNGNDIYVYNKQDGDLWIRDGGATTDTDRLVLTDLNSTDLTFDRIGDDLLLRVTATGKTVVIDSFFASQGIDVLRFANGTEWDRSQIASVSVFRGDGHNNAIADSGSHDVIRGGKGDDYITISGGSDTILYSKGDGYDVVHDTIGQISERDTFVLTDLNANDIQLSRVGSHLLLTVKSTGEYVDFDNFFPSNSGDRQTKSIDIIKFADGTSWDRTQIMQQAWYRGTDRLDSIVTNSELNDTIYGGKGDDFLQGWTGSDTYVWKKGDGNDEISDFSSKIGNPSNTDIDTLWLQDVSAGEVSYSYQGGTLLITINTTGEIIRVNDFFSGVTSLLDGNAGNWVGIDRIKFRDGSVIDRAQITYNAGRDYLGWDPVVVTMVEQGLIVWQTYWDEFGHEGNIVAGASPGIHDIWNASSYGGLGGTLGTPLALQPNPFHGGGNNKLNGSDNIDIMAGGLGADVFNGLAGNDVFYGDEIGSDSVGDNDVILGGGGNDILYGGGGSDYLDGWIGSDFISGGDGKDYVLANEGDDIVIGGKGDDLIYNNNGAGSGNDTYLYAKGDGNDLIVEGGSADADVLILTDLTSSEVELSQQADDLLIRIKATNEVITVTGHFSNRTGDNNAAGVGLEYIRFADMQWDRAQIHQNAWIRGTDGRDILNGRGTLSDLQLGATFDAGKGNDVIYSGRSSDTFVYANGDGNDIIYETDWHAAGSNVNDTLKFTDLNAANVELTRSGEDLLIKVLATGEVITITSQFNSNETNIGAGIERIQFANGEQWNRFQIQQNAWFRGTDGRDLIDARISRMDDTIEAGKGDDIIYTGLQGASGNDTFIYSKGDGNDTIYENTWRSFTSTETDVLVLKDILSSEVNLTRSGDNLLIQILSTNETITIVGQFGDATDTPDSGIEYIRFANGDQWGRSTIYGIATSNSPFLVGTNGNDVLIGSSANQNLYGEAGDDRIDGQGGNDLLYGGLGNDTLVLSVSAPGDIATVNGGAGTDTLDLSGFGSAVWVDLVTNGAEVRTTDQSDLASGTWRDMAQVEQVENLIGTAFSDQIAGDAGNNLIVGGAGNDLIDARSGDDVVSGGSGDDALTGGMGKDKLDGGIGADILNGGLDNDILIGGAGNDVATGGTGADIFVVGVGDGSDTVTDFIAGSGADHDMVRFDRTMFADFASVIAAASQVGSDVVISLGNGDSLTLQNVDLAALTADNFEFRRLGNEAPTGITVTGGTVQENAVGGTVVATLAAVDAGDAGAHSFSIVGTDDLFEIVGNQIRVKNGAVLDFETQPQHTLTVKAVDDDGMSVTSTIAIGITDAVETVAGTSGKDVLAGGAGSDILIGGAGNDRLNGGSGSDEYRYGPGDGSDRIVDNGGSTDTDRLVLGSGIDPDTTTVGRSSLDNSDIVLQLANGDTIVLQDQLSASAGAGVEQIVFAGGAVWSRSDLLARLDNHLFIGGAGNQIAAGSGTSDVFVAGSGAETLVGYGGNDTYRVRASAGNVIISEYAEDGTDRLELVGLNAGDVTLIRRGADLIVKNKATGHTTTITNEFSYAPTGVEQVAFADGTVWDKTQVASHAVLPTAAGNYTVVGTSEDDTFQPLAGNDLIQGGGGSDTVIYALGDGSDTINDGDNSASQVDVLKLVDLRPGDVIFSRQGSDLSIAIPGSGDVITVQGQFTSTSDYWGLEQIQFSDGTVWDRSAIAAAAWIRGTNAAETLNGFATGDTLDGGAGADALVGGDGGDTYIYRAGSGNDVIQEIGADSGTDVVKLVGLNASDVSFGQGGDDLFIQIKSSAEVLKVQGQFNGINGIEQVLFADGTRWDRSQIANAAQLVGTGGNDTITLPADGATIDPGAGDDTLSVSGNGADRIVFYKGAGHDTLNNPGSGYVRADVLDLTDILPSEVQLTRSGNQLIVSVPSTGDNFTVLLQFSGNSYGLGSIKFADGTIWDRTAIIANAWLRGTSGNDSIGLPSTGVTVDAGAGDDTISVSGNGSDHIIFGSGYGHDTLTNPGSGYNRDDTLVLKDLNPSDVQLSRNGDAMTLKVLSTGDTFVVNYQFWGDGSQIQGLTHIQFADGTVWDRAAIASNAWLRGTSGNDSLSASASADTLFGDQGNDYLQGNGGSDTYLYRSGDGNDEIADRSNSATDVDILKFADLNASDVTVSRSGNALLVTANTSGATIKVT